MNEIGNLNKVVVPAAPTQRTDRSANVGTVSSAPDVNVTGNVAGEVDVQRTESAARLEQQQAELDAALAELNRRSTSVSPSLQFEQDRESGITVIKVIDRDTGELIRQLPPEAVTRASAAGEDILPPLVNTEV